MARRDPKSWPVPAEETDAKCLADIQEFGWHCVGVEEDDEGPGFVYSVGLFEIFQHPEVIVVGLSLDTMFAIVNGVGELVREGVVFQDLDESSDVLHGFPVIARSVLPGHFNEHFGVANWFYRPEAFPALQIVWPDRSIRYPWNPGFSLDQPRLFDEGAWPFPAGRNRAVFTTRPVIEGKRPIVHVAHDDDGDWQFLCGSTTATEDGRLFGLGELVDGDPTLAAVADLPEGWEALRPRVGADWRRVESPPEEDEEPEDDTDPEG